MCYYILHAKPYILGLNALFSDILYNIPQCTLEVKILSLSYLAHYTGLLSYLTHYGTHCTTVFYSILQP